MRFLVLGPLEIDDVGWSVESLPSRQRTVLAMLLLQANSVVPVDQLVDAVWGGSPPRTARSQIQICVSQLRQRFSAAALYDVIGTRPPGYSFRIQHGQLDLDVFRSSVGEGRDAVKRGDLEAGARHLRSALLMWRGEAFADIESEKVESAATFLGEQRIAVAEECMEVELQLGHHNELIGELSALIDRYPFRERLRAQLMISLYRAGRQAEALQVFRDARSVLQEELGLEPGPELRELERAILVADPVLEPAGGFTALNASAVSLAAPSVPRLLPTTIGDFTGRRRQIAQLRRRLAAHTDDPGARRLAPAIEVITGKGGIGKTTLAVHLAHQLSEEYPDGQLYVRLQDSALKPVPAGEVLETFLRALGVTGKEMPAEVEARAAMYRDRLAGRKVLLLLDNAVDEGQVLTLLPGTTSCAVLVTSRARLTGLPGAHQTVLHEFDDELAVELVENVLGSDSRNFDGAQLRRLARLCGGLPLALRIAAARLAAHPHWTVPHLTQRLSDETRTLDEFTHGSLDIRDNIALSCQQLPTQAHSLFRRLALVDAPDFGSWVAAGLAGTGVTEAEDILDTLLDAHLIEVETRPGVAPRYRLHDLIRRYARERLEAAEPGRERDAALSRLLGACLFLAETAHGREYGGGHTMLTGTAKRWIFEANEVENILGDPLEWLERELPTLSSMVLRACSLDEHELAWSLALPLITLYESRGGFEEWRRVHGAVLEAVTAAGNTRGRAAMLYSLGTMHVHKEDFPEAELLLQQAQDAFAEVGDELGGALAVRNRAYLARVRGEVGAAMTGYEQALEALRRVDDRVGQAHVLNSMAQIRLTQERFGEAAALLEQALDVAQLTNSRRVNAQIFHRFGELHLHCGRTEAAAESFRNALTEVREAGDRTGEAFSLHGLGLVHLRAGRHADAEEVLGHALTLATQSMQQILSARILVALADVHCSEGRQLKAARDLATAFPAFVRAGAAPWQIDVLKRFHELQVEESEAALFSVLADRILAAMPDGADPDVEIHARALRRRLAD